MEAIISPGWLNNPYREPDHTADEAARRQQTLPGAVPILAAVMGPGSTASAAFPALTSGRRRRAAAL